MRKLFSAVLFTGLVTTGVAFADDPPTEPPPAPTPPPDAPPPVEPEKPATPPPVPTETKPPPATSDPAPTSSQPKPFDHMSATATAGISDGKRKNPKFAIELSGAGGKLADPYIVYKGWTLENGASKGTRLEGHLAGIMLAYELTSLANTKACADGCFSGDFGSTSFHSFEIGYRYRIRMIGPVRPFVTASLGGVRADAGGWAMESGASFGGVARGAFGVEIPIAGRFFASGALSYRLFITDNPYRSKETDAAQKLFIGDDGKDAPNGDFADDAHVIGVNIGVGVTL